MEGDGGGAGHVADVDVGRRRWMVERVEGGGEGAGHGGEGGLVIAFWGGKEER